MKPFTAVFSLLILCGFAAAELQNVEAGPVIQLAASLDLKDTLKENAAATETTLADQTDIAVTVYNNDRALVRDRRKIQLLPGEVSLKFMDVAEQIKPETVSIKSLSSPGKLHILEQNYEYDLMSPQKLMEKYAGRDVRLINKDNDLSFYEVDAKLLSVNNGPVYEIDGAIYLGHPGTVVLPEMPEELIAKPSLIWLLDNRGTDHEVEATYMTGGISWRADYVLTMAKDEKALDIEGWVTLNNQSGAAYTNAKLKLVAGEVNIVREPRGMGRRADKMLMAAEAAPAPMQEESFAEYHLYTLPRRTTIAQNQTKQVRLLTAQGATVKKIYEFRGNLHWYRSRNQNFAPEHAGVFLLFENSEENNLGMPLPAGIMRIYQEDSESMLQFAGEDRIKHIPKDEEVRLQMGQAFDVVAERKQTDWKRIMDNVFESEFEITVRNHKETDIVVRVVEPMPGDWKVLNQSHDHKKEDAFSAVFPVPVKADGEETLTYRIRVTY
jgi:hypothetical protein